jgi:hypothetical protein
MKKQAKTRCSGASDEVDLEMDEREEIIKCLKVLTYMFVGLALTKIFLVGFP